MGITFSFFIPFQIMTQRNYTIDIFRILGAFCVVSLHSPLDELPNNAALLIRLLSRWAVPFFFLVSGYFIAINVSKKGDSVFLKSINNLIAIYIISNIIYAIFYLTDADPTTNTNLDFTRFLSGQSGHLWFLASSIFGLLMLQYCASRYSNRTLLAIAALAFAAILILSGYSKATELTAQQETIRYLTAIPFLFTGFLIARNDAFVKQLSVTGCIMALVTGIILELGEAFLLHKKFGASPHNQELLIGTAIIALSLFCLSLVHVISTDNSLSLAGRKYSLLIYLYHPLIISIIYNTANHMPSAHILNLVSPVIVYFVTLALIMFIDKFIPKLFNKLIGS